MARIDIVMPAHNGGRFIAEAMSGVRAQTIGNWQLHVIDDASTDDTAEIVSRVAANDGRVRLTSVESNIGAAAARNLGFGAGTAPFVIFLDSDDIWLPDALETLLGALAASPEAPGAHGLAERMDEFGQPALERGQVEIVGARRPAVIDGKRRYLRAYEGTGRSSFAVSSEIPTPGLVLLRREHLETVGGEPWDQAAFPADDWELWFRLTGEHGFVFVPRVVLRYRRHGAQATGAADARLRAADAYVRGRFMELCASPEEQAMIVEGARFHAARMGALRRRWALDSLRRGRPVEATKQVRHAAKAFADSRGWVR